MKERLAFGFLSTRFHIEQQDENLERKLQHLWMSSEVDDFSNTSN
jgi:hypothetical protein